LVPSSFRASLSLSLARARALCVSLQLSVTVHSKALSTLRQSASVFSQTHLLAVLGSGAVCAVVFVLALPTQKLHLLHSLHSAPIASPSPDPQSQGENQDREKQTKSQDRERQTSAERDSGAHPSSSEWMEDLSWSIHEVAKCGEESGTRRTLELLSTTAAGKRERQAKGRGRPASPSPRSPPGSTRRKKSCSPPGTPSAWQTTRFSWIDTDHTDHSSASPAALPPDSYLPRSECFTFTARQHLQCQGQPEAAPYVAGWQKGVWQMLRADSWARLAACGGLGVAATLCKETGAAVILHAILQVPSFISSLLL
jgi:hypothetical protein